MSVVKNIKSLCTPAFIYFTLSILLIFITLVNSLRTKRLKNMLLIMIVLKLIYVVFWSWVLNLICKSGHPNISWLLVLFPFIFIFLVMLTMKIKK